LHACHIMILGLIILCSIVCKLIMISCGWWFYIITAPCCFFLTHVLFILMSMIVGIDLLFNAYITILRDALLHSDCMMYKTLFRLSYVRKDKLTILFVWDFNLCYSMYLLYTIPPFSPQIAHQEEVMKAHSWLYLI
jgi:hypothetical protein